jgi:hypothetical protein
MPTALSPKSQHWLWPVWTWCEFDEFDPIHQHVYCLPPMLLQDATMLATPQAFVRDPRWDRGVLMGGDGGEGGEGGWRGKGQHRNAPDKQRLLQTTKQGTLYRC